MDDFYISKVRDGDHKSFRYLVDKYKDRSFSLALGIVKDSQLAADVVQESFINAFKGLRTFEGRSGFATWFYKIVVNESLKHITKNKSFRNFVDAEFPDNSTTVDNEAISLMKLNDQKKYVNETLDEMESRDSLVLRLHYLDDLKLSDIADIVGINENNVKIILFRARNEFLIILQRKLKSEIHSLI